MPEGARPTWMPAPLWECLEMRMTNDDERAVEVFDPRSERVYGWLTRSELCQKHLDVYEIVCQRMRRRYFIVHHPERIMC